MDLKFRGDEKLILNEDKSKLLRVEGYHFLDENNKEIDGTIAFYNCSINSAGELIADYADINGEKKIFEIVLDN